MDTDGILKALEGGEFDGVSHHYQPYKGYGKTTYQKSMSVSGGAITSPRRPGVSSSMAKRTSAQRIPRRKP